MYIGRVRYATPDTLLNTFKQFFFFLFCFLTSVFAVPFYGNNSDIRWKTASTEHFYIHYPAEYREHAEKTAAVAEAVYDSVTSRYPHKISSRIHLALRNALYSNGLAIPAENSMNLWLTNWDFKLRSSHGWLTDVVSHEFSHLVSIENGSKIVPSLYGFQISYTDYYNERTRTDALGILPLTLQPLWFAEGTAQFESERMGFDAWDTHRDMLLRVATLSDSLLPLQDMHSFAEDSKKSELGPYTQGFSLVRFIAAHYGEESVPAVWTELSKPYRATLSGAFEKVLGIDEDSLYGLWKKELQQKYAESKKALGNLVTGKKMTTDSYYQDFPVVAGNYLYGISNFGGKHFDGGVFKIRKSLDSLQDEESTEDDLVLLDFEGTIDIGKYAESGFKPKKMWVDKGIAVRDIPERGPLLAYVSYQNRDRNGHATFDIFITDTLNHSYEITHLTNAVYPDIHPKGNKVLFARRENASTRFILSEAPYEQNEKALDYKDIWTPPKNKFYFNIYSPKYSPDGKQIAFGFFDDTTRGLALIQADGSDFKILTEPGIDARDVAWKNNHTLIYSADRNGIFNLYELDLKTSMHKPLTNVLGGAFTPAVDSSQIFYIGYDSDGFSLYSLPIPEPKSTSDSSFEHLHALSEFTDFVIPFTASFAEPQKLYTPKPPFAQPSTSSFEELFFISEQTTIDNIKKSAADSAQPDSLASIKSEPLNTSNDTLILKGTRLKNEHPHPPILNDISFAGSERSYKPIPLIPLFVPILSFEDNAPDFSVHGEGSLHAKLGTAVLLSDPLKKNTVQLGLLLEITNGLDYINGNGINPDKQYDFFALWENRSTPITFNLGYSYANLTSKDTVRYEDPRSYGDSIGVSNYAMELQAIQASAGYSLFKKGDTLAVNAGYDWANFNLYEDQFDWTFHKRLSVGTLLGFYGDLPEESESSISGRGNGVAVSYRFSNSDLYRSGTFSETFVITESGTIKPIYRNYLLHEIAVGLFGSLQNPIHSGARLAGGLQVSGILNWTAENKKDTLDSYYNQPLLLEGYPLLISTEDYNRSGTKTAIAQIHYLFPIYKDFKKRFWIFETRDFYIDLFAQVGAAWHSKWLDFSSFKTRDFWDRSVGLEFRFSNTLFYSFPFEITLGLTRGLDRIGENDDGSGGRKMTPIDLGFLPESIAPTRIRFSIGTGFNNFWQN